MDRGEIAGTVIGIIIYILIIALIVASQWKIFTKAGKPGWAAIIPIYNMIVLLEIVKKPLWMIILFFIPIANLVLHIIICIELSNNFGKSGGFAAGLILLPMIFFPMIAFGDAKYEQVTQGNLKPEDFEAKKIAPKPKGGFCTNCGVPLESGAQFCIDCGTKIG